MEWLASASGMLLPLLLFGLWCVWWLLCVNGKKAWAVLGQGGWAPVVLLVLVAALAWSRIFPATFNRLGFPIANFVWQLLVVIGWTLAAMFCGWVQGQFGWAPAEVEFDPPAPAHGHDDHAHAAHH
jgi:hypothetical protein